MSDTPRVDAMIVEMGHKFHPDTNNYKWAYRKMTDLASELERKNARLREAVERLLTPSDKTEEQIAADRAAARDLLSNQTTCEAKPSQ